MRILVGLCAAALLALVACAGNVVADTCEESGGACVASEAKCGETLPYPCGQSNQSCCRSN